MAKFKVGDKVRLVEDVKAGTAGAWTLYRGSAGVVDEVQSVRGKEYLVEFPEGSFYVGADKVAANSAPCSTNPVVQNAIKVKNSGCTNEYKSRAKAAIDDGYRLLCESVAILEHEANRFADIARSYGDKNEWNVILRKQSLLADLVEKSWKDAQRLINS